MQPPLNAQVRALTSLAPRLDRVRLRPRILFVSGDAELRAAVTRALEGEEYEVAAVPHSGHALLRCRTAAYDLLVADLSGPDMSGPTLAELVRRQCPHIRSLFLGHPGTLDRVDNLLVAPFTCQELVARVGAALSETAPVRTAHPA